MATTTNHNGNRELRSTTTNTKNDNENRNSNKHHKINKGIQNPNPNPTCPTATTSKPKTTMKSCRCILCGQTIYAESEEDCIAHMAQCDAFQRVHPETGVTNPNGVYPPTDPSSTSPSPSTSSSPPVAPTTSEDSKSSRVSEEDVERMTVKELKSTIKSAGLTFHDCIEKQDLRIRAREAVIILGTGF